MTSAALDRLLAVLVLALASSGLVSLRMGASADAWLFALHGILGGALAVTVAWKIGTSLPRAIRARRWRRVILGLLVSFATAAALVGGFAWVVSGRLLSIGAWTVLTVHAWIGLALIPLVLIHLAPRRWRLLIPRKTTIIRRSPMASRRGILVVGALTAVSFGLFGATQLADRLAGGIRRFTGSRWLPSGGVPPPTTFFGDTAPAIDLDGWRLRIHGRVSREITLSIDDLAELGEIEMVAVLDCTSGWAMETAWQGVPLTAVLDMAGVATDAPSVRIVSATGWAATLPRGEADRALLATQVAGAPLPVANGAPCRLVIPDHRGLDWVKWVTEIEAT